MSSSRRTLFQVEASMIFEAIVFEMTSDVNAITISTSDIIEIRNCTFNHISGRANAIYAPYSIIANALIEDSSFNELGSGDILFVSNSNANSSLTFFNCSITNVNKTSNIIFLDSSSENIVIDSCKFSQTYGSVAYRYMQSIKIRHSVTNGTFTFINNDVFNPIGRFIGLELYHSPIFANNFFHDFNRPLYSENRGEYFMDVTLISPLASFTFENNTYQNIFGGADYNGGIATWICSASSYTRITIEFNNCKFINVSNTATGYYPIPIEYRTQGGAFHHGFSNTIKNANLIFNSCEFTENYVHGCGGALAFEVEGDVIIFDCNFNSNRAITNPNLPDCLTYGRAIFFSNNYRTPSLAPQQLVTIKNCSFIGNEGTKGSAIYYHNDASTTQVQFIIESCKFENNGPIGKSQILCHTAHVTFFDNIVEYTSSAQIAQSNEFAVMFPSAETVDMHHCNFYNHQKSPSNGGFLDITQNSSVGGLIYDKQFNIDHLIFDGGFNLESLKLILPKMIVFSSENITIVNQQSDNAMYHIEVYQGSEAESVIHLTNWNFSLCTATSNYGGGTGAKLFASSAIQFYSCSWNNNYITNDNGGGMSFQSSDPISLQCINCHFERNKASKHGGALYLDICASLTIQDCTFYNNIAGYKETSLNTLADDEQMGGAIYITGCENGANIIRNPLFVENSGDIGHALFIDENKTVQITSDNLFTDNGYSKYVIYSKNSQLQLDNPTFNYSYTENFPAKCLTVFDSDDCNIDGQTFYCQLKFMNSRMQNVLTNCNFIDVESDPTDADPQNQFVVWSTSSYFAFENCTISYSEEFTGRTLQGLGIISPSTRIENCSFIRCKYINFAGGFFYQNPGIQGHFDFYNVTFDGIICNDINTNAPVFNMNIGPSEYLIENITINSCRGLSLGQLQQTSIPNAFIFNSWFLLQILYWLQISIHSSIG